MLKNGICNQTSGSGGVRLSEVSLREKGKSCVFSLMCGLKESQTKRETTGKMRVIARDESVRPPGTCWSKDTNTQLSDA